MSGAPGSLLWLLRHEMMLQWRANSRGKLSLIATFGLALLFFHLLGAALAAGFAQMPAIPARALLIGVTGASLALLLFMMSMGLVAAMQAIYQRGDMELLLTAPIEPRSIMFVRMIALTLNLCVGTCALILPFANMLALFVTAKWLLAYVAIPSLALVASSLSLIAALGLFRLLGARRARICAQILGVVVGIAAVMLGQLPNLLPKGAKTSAEHWFADFAARMPAPDSVAWLPARALTGEPLLLAAFVAVCIGLFAVTVYALADRFIASATAAGGVATTPAKKRTDRSLRFRTETMSAMRRKELRLLGRDPWLLTQVGQQIIYVVPSLFLIWQNSGATFGWIMLVFIAGMLASALAWITISGEDAPELLGAAPVPTTKVLRAKFEAALLPVLLALLVPVAFASRSDGWLGLTLLVCGTGSALCGALLQLAFPGHGKRSEFNKRGKGRWVVGLLEMAFAAIWASAAALMVAHSLWALLPPLLVVIPLAVRFYVRTERQAPAVLRASVAAA